MPDLNKIVEDLSKLTVVEAAELSKTLEEKWGVSSASFLLTPALSCFGAPSTKSLASFKPKPVNALTSLIAPILLSPDETRLTIKSFFSSAGAPLAAAGAAAATGAAADTPHFSSKVLEKYLKWGIENGLEETDIKLIDKKELKKSEPEIKI